MTPATNTLRRLLKLYVLAIDLCLAAPEDQLLIRARLNVENILDTHLSRHPHEGHSHLRSLLNRGSAETWQINLGIPIAA
jgi:hypothetical protein